MLALEDVILLTPDGQSAYQFTFRTDFVDEVLRQNLFDGKAKQRRPQSACIEVQDSSKDKRYSAVVTEIFLVDRTLLDRLREWRPFDRSNSWHSSFKIYAIKSPQQPKAASDTPPEPTPAPASAPQPPLPARSVSDCPQTAAPAAFDTLLSQGVVGAEDVKILNEKWCAVEPRFYDRLKTTADNDLQYRLARFVRTSITAVDLCWASSDKYRTENATAEKVKNCNRKLDQPRDLSRLLPFAQKAEAKAALIAMLSDDSLTVRREVEIMLRLYPHDDFHPQFEKRLTGDAQPAELRPVAMAAIAYYYNRGVEFAWAEKTAAAAAAAATGVTTEVNRGLKWVERLSGPEKAAARARLHYARAHVLLQVWKGKPPTDIEQRVRSDYGEMLKLQSDELTVYPFPYHLARANVYTNGKPDEVLSFGNLEIDSFERQAESKPVKVDSAIYEEGLWLHVLPDLKSTKLKKLASAETIRVLMRFGANGKKTDDKNDGAWDFVATSSGLGWLKRRGKTS